MSSHERHEEPLRPCPCGRGSLLRVRLEWNNMYSGVDTSYELDCIQCALRYEVKKAALFARTDLQAEREARDAFRQLEDEFRERFLNPLADEVERLARANGRTKTRWIAALTPLAGAFASGFSYEFSLSDELHRTSLKDFCHGVLCRRNYSAVASHFSPVLDSNPPLLTVLNAAWRRCELRTARPVRF